MPPRRDQRVANRRASTASRSTPRTSYLGSGRMESERRKSRSCWVRSKARTPALSSAGSAEAPVRAPSPAKKIAVSAPRRRISWIASREASVARSDTSIARTTFSMRRSTCPPSGMIRTIPRPSRMLRLAESAPLNEADAGPFGRDDRILGEPDARWLPTVSRVGADDTDGFSAGLRLRAGLPRVARHHGQPGCPIAIELQGADAVSHAQLVQCARPQLGDLAERAVAGDHEWGH